MSEEPQEAGEDDVLLMRTWSDGEAEVVRHLLESYGVLCRVASDIAHSVLPLSVDGLGEIRILVSRENLTEAKNLLAAHLRQGLELVEGGQAAEDDGGEEEADLSAPGAGS